MIMIMKHTQKQGILALLALLCAASVFSSCGSPSDKKDDKTPNTENHPATDATTEAPAPERIKANLPDKDFGGETFTFYGRIYEGEWTANDIFSHTEDGELINDALYNRTTYIEETYNVKLDAIESGEVTVTSKLKTLLTAGDTSFQAICCDVYDAGALSVEGMLLDLNHVENLDLSADWWAQQTNASLSIANKQFYVTGDISIVDNRSTRVFFFNKDIIRALDLENPYELVDNNQWTIEKFIELSEAALSDLDGDGVYDRLKDQFGVMAQKQFGSVLYIASGNLLTGKDDHDIPYALCGTNKALDVMTGISDKISGMRSVSLSDDSVVTNGIYPDNIVYFMEGRALFAPEVLTHIATMRNCTVDIGILPPPKYEASQDAYYCYADGWCVNVYSIPSTNVNSADAGFILEAMAADSKNNLTPAYFNVVLTDKYARDEQSVRMLDLILNSQVMDNANIFSWASIESTVANAIYNGGAIASTIEKKMSTLNKMIDKTVSKIEAVEN